MLTGMRSSLEIFMTGVPFDRFTLSKIAEYRGGIPHAAGLERRSKLQLRHRLKGQRVACPPPTHQFDGSSQISRWRSFSRFFERLGF